MRIFLLLPALLFALPPCGRAAEFTDKGGTIAVDFPDGWSAGKSDDPAVTLKLERGKSFFEFSRQDSELSDYYLKASVKEQVDSLRSKGTSLAGDVRAVSVRGITTAYFTSYESMGSPAYIAFFTYNSASYAISATGMSESDFRGVLAGLRKPGEKIEVPKPKKVRVVRRKKEKEEEPKIQLSGEGPDVSTSAVDGSTESILNAFSDKSTTTPIEVSTQGLSAAAGDAAKGLMTELSRQKEEDAGLPPYIARKPLPVLFWALLIGLWIVGSFAARKAAASYQNPKLPPPPADVPPDFFFPFLISRYSTMRETLYQVVTRQKQRLVAEFASEHEVYIAGSVYGLLFFHAAWSLLGSVAQGDAAVTNVLLRVPLLGRALASVPEAVFLVPLLAGLSKYFTARPVLQLLDGQSNLIMEVSPDAAYGLIRDGSGKEVARLVRKGSFMSRSWDFVDTDNQIVFTIRDDFPRGRLLRMLFGNLGGALRSHYGIFAEDRRAGFVFLDPSAPNRFQIHMDFAFSRLGHPAQILAAMLYVITREKDPSYPSPF